MKNSLKKIFALALAVSGLEILWNLLYGRLPVYLSSPASPFPAIPLNALAHIVFTAAVFLVPGFLLSLVPLKLTRERGARFVAAAYVAYISVIVVSRYLFLNESVSYAGYKNIVILAILVSVGATLAIAGAAGKTRHPGSGLLGSMLALSWFIASSGLYLKYSLHPLGLIALLAALLAAFHLAAWLFLRRVGPAPSRLFSRFFLAVILLVFARGLWSGVGRGTNGPHLVFLVLDAARADRMSLHGYPVPTTPLIDSLADSGSLVFEQAYSVSNYTFPSHVSMFTGLYIRSHDMWHGTDSEMARYRELDNLAAGLSGRGYRTLLLTENPWIAGLHGGFHHYHYLNLSGMPVSGWHGTWKDLSSTPSAFLPFSSNTPSPFAARNLLDQLQFNLQGYYKPIVADYQLRLLREQLLLRRRGQPVFYFINWMTVHNRYYPAPGREFGKTIKPYDWSSDYDRAMVHIDRRVAELWELFDRAGELDRTVFIVSSDHGELLGEYRIFGHTRTFFQGVIRIPLAFISPVWEGRKTAETPVCLVAVKPALEFLADHWPDPDLRKGLVPILEDRPVVAEHRSIQPGPDGEYLRGWMLVSPDRTKLIRDGEAPALNSTWGDTEYFLFDLENDPGEEVNLYPARPRDVKRVEELYRGWKEATPAAESGEAGRIAPGLRDRLRAMGYLQ